MTVRTVHILTEEGDTIPTTGDPVITLYTADPTLFAPPRPGRVLTEDEALAATTLHELLSLTETDE